MKHYKWIESAPNYNLFQSYNRYGDWLTETFGRTTWANVGWAQKQNSNAERFNWTKIATVLYGIDATMPFQPKLRSVNMMEGPNWTLLAAGWYLTDPEYAHKAAFWVLLPSDTEIIQFKLSCL